MKKLILFLLPVVMICLPSCVTTNHYRLYNWGSYSDTSYNYFKNPGDATLKELMDSYEYIMSHQSSTYKQTIPPGICADYGYMLIQSGKTAEGIELLNKEIELYPESKTYIDSIKEMVNAN